MEIFDNRIMAENPKTLREHGDKYHISRARLLILKKSIRPTKMPNLEAIEFHYFFYQYADLVEIIGFLLFTVYSIQAFDLSVSIN